MTLAATELACLRYPNVPPELALRYFFSDRRHAGLGALDASRRRQARSKSISNYKEVGLDDGRVYYTMCRDIRESWEYPKFEPISSPLDYVFSTTIQRVEIPEFYARLCLPIDPRDFDEQSDRAKIAVLLHKMRKQIRSAAPATTPGGAE